ncbi:MAG: sugar transferase, partial [Geminicoccaceae bacterium]|nr:sugar transferase [Geminicoccaceae bacterium]
MITGLRARHTGVRPGFLLDLAMGALSLPLASWLRFGDPDTTLMFVLRTPETLATFLAIFALVIAACRLPSSVWQHLSTSDLLQVVKVATIAIVLAYTILFVLSRLEAVPRSLPALHWLVLVALMLGPRLATIALAQRRARGRPLDALCWQPVLLVGAGDCAALLSRLFRMRRDTTYEIVGILDDRTELAGRRIDGIPILGTTADLDRVTARLALHGARPRHLVMADMANRHDQAGLLDLYTAARRHDIAIRDLVDVLRTDPAERHGPLPGDVMIELERRSFIAAKRLVDIMLSATGLLLASPFMAVLAGVILVGIGRPVIFHQVRPGRDLKAFTLYKFRSLAQAHRDDGSFAADDERLTGPGRFMRRTRLDELPQLWNVLKGDMSLIGPRPLLAGDLSGIGADLHERASLRPGLTGWAQVHGGHQLTSEQKLALDLFYIRNYSPWLDIVILARTVSMVLFGEKIDHDAIRRARGDHP